MIAICMPRYTAQVVEALEKLHNAADHISCLERQLLEQGVFL